MNNVKCTSCLVEWQEMKIKTLASNEIDGQRIAYKGGSGWKELLCHICNNTAVRLPVSGKIEEHQLNHVAARNNDYYV